MTSSPYRFVSSRRRGEYSVWRGEQHVGYIEKIVHRINVHGVTKTRISGWQPIAGDGSVLALCATRDAAAAVLWKRS